MRDDGAQVELQDHMLLGDLCNADGSLVVHIIDTDPTSTANTLATASCPVRSFVLKCVRSTDK